MVDRYKLKLTVAALLLGLLTGCTSPEARRARGDGYGSGADPGNHPPAAEIDPCSKVFTERCDP